MQKNYTLRLAPETRAVLDRAAATAGMTPTALARQLIMAGLDKGRRDESLVERLADAVAAELRPALAALTKTADAALRAREFVDLYGPSYLTICDIAKRLDVPVHAIAQTSREIKS